MSKIQQNKEQKRRAITAAAREVFLSAGYAHASMDKIAAQAGVTKQTVYRYYPSKVELFKATLKQIGESAEFGFTAYLQEPDTAEALYKFACGFIRAHLSEEHLAIYRLLMAEGRTAPELVSSFRSVGPDDTLAELVRFFEKRMGVKSAETSVKMWTGMLLAHRSGVLIGMEKPDEQQIEEYARAATDFLLRAVSEA